MPEIEIRETLVKQGEHVEGQGVQSVYQVLRTVIDLPHKSGIYQTPVGEIGVDISGIGEDPYARNILVVEGEILGGSVSVELRNRKGEYKISDNKEVNIYVREAPSLPRSNKPYIGAF